MSKENKTIISIMPYTQVSYIKNTQSNKKYNKEYHNLEEFSKNKFDSKFYQRFNFRSSRKCSKDSSNLSTSNEDIFENDFYEKKTIITN